MVTKGKAAMSAPSLSLRFAISEIRTIKLAVMSIFAMM